MERGTAWKADGLDMDRVEAGSGKSPVTKEGCLVPVTQTRELGEAIFTSSAHVGREPSELSSATKWRTEPLYQALPTCALQVYLPKTSTVPFYLLSLMTVVYCKVSVLRETGCNFIQFSFCLLVRLSIFFASVFLLLFSVFLSFLSLSWIQKDHFFFILFSLFYFII